MASTKRDQPWEYSLRKYLLLLATLVATITYGTGFNPPGGVWQDTDTGHLAGDPIIRDTHYRRYLVFFYCNATAFASSLVVIVLILLLAVLQERRNVWITVDVLLLRVVMVADLLSLMGAYAAGTCRDAFTTVYSSLLVTAVFAYLVVQTVLASLPDKNSSDDDHDGAPADAAATAAAAGVGHRNNVLSERPRKVLMLLATFAISVTYVSGLSTPGGFWDGTQPGRRAGDAVLQDHNQARLAAFFVCNTTAFVASLLTVLLLLDRKLRDSVGVRYVELHGCIVVALVGLVAAYAAGSCREAETTAYVVGLVVAVLGYIVFQVTAFGRLVDAAKKTYAWAQVARVHGAVSEWVQQARRRPCFRRQSRARQLDNDGREELQNQSLDKARSLVLLLATLATTVTYQAGLDPPGGLWEDNADGHIAGDPILLTTNPRRYKTIYYCNSTAFMASLVAIVLVQKRFALKRHTLEAAMILDLFGLIGAYAAGSCRDVSTSVYVVALAGAVLVYVVIHVVFFTLDHHGGKVDDEVQLEKRRKRLLLFAILAATITYQAGLTPPSGFWPENDELAVRRAGDPVLLSGAELQEKKAAAAAAATSNHSSNPVEIVAEKQPQERVMEESKNTMPPPQRPSQPQPPPPPPPVYDINRLPHDPGERQSILSYHVNDQDAIRRAYIIKGPFKPFAHNFLKRKISDRDRGFNYCWMYNHDWLEYSIKKDAVFCFICYLFKKGTGSDTFTVDGWKNWNIGEKSLLKHLGSKTHIAAQERYIGFKNPKVAIDYNIEKWSEEDFGLYYSNSLSFMSSIAHIILLVNPNLYRPAIRSYALSVCTAAGLFGLMGAYAAGSTQHLKTSIYIFVLLALVVVFVALLLVVFSVKHLKKSNNTTTAAAAAPSEGSGADGKDPTRATDGVAEEEAPGRAGGADDGGGGDEAGKEAHAKCKYLMLLGILVASVTYQAGLDPPGGVWQGDGEGHVAGNPVLRSHRRLRYLFFFHCNSTSFVASVVVVLLLLPRSLVETGWWLGVMNATIVLDLLGLLGAHAAGSSRGWETSGYVVALIVAVLAYVAVHAVMSFFSSGSGGGISRNPSQLLPEPPKQLQGEGDAGHHQSLGDSV